MRGNGQTGIPVGLVIGQLHHGGAERQLFELAVRLGGRGYRPVVISLTESVHPYGPLLQEQGIPMHALVRRTSFDPLRVRDLRRLLLKEKVRLVHAFLHIANAYAWASMTGLRRIPLLASVRNCEVDRPWLYRQVDRVVFSQCGGVLANSAAVRDFVVAAYGLKKSHLRVIYNGLDANKFSPPERRDLFKARWRIPPGSVVVGGVGRLEKQKRFEWFIELARSTREEMVPVFFLIAGAGRERNVLEEKIRAANLQDRFRITTPVDPVQDLYSAMDIFLLTSYKEGLPNVVMEAMAMELPCVVTDAGGSRELVQEGITGHVVPLGREWDLRDRLRDLIHNAEIRRIMGRAGRNRIEKEFTLEKMVHRTADWYDDLLNPAAC